MHTLVLFNGGLKSTFLAELAKREGSATLCYFVYTPSWPERQNVVANLAQVLGLPLVVNNLMGPPSDETLLRLLYLTLHALPIAKELQCTCIYHGLSKDDDTQIIPVLEPFTKQLNNVLKLAQPLYDGKGIWLGSVEVETPLRMLDRPRVIRLGNEWSIPWELTHSCNQDPTRHCGLCPGCVRRKKAFKREGRADPTAYKVY